MILSQVTTATTREVASPDYHGIITDFDELLTDTKHKYAPVFDINKCSSVESL